MTPSVSTLRRRSGHFGQPADGAMLGRVVGTPSYQQRQMTRTHAQARTRMAWAVAAAATASVYTLAAQGLACQELSAKVVMAWRSACCTP
jgi:hypothetical protein